MVEAGRPRIEQTDDLVYVEGARSPTRSARVLDSSAHLRSTVIARILCAVKRARVLVVHHRRIVAEALARRLEHEPTLQVLGSAWTSAMTRSAVAALGPDVVLVEVPPEGDGHREIEAIVAMRSGLRVVAILLDETMAADAIRAGADGVLSVRDETATLASAVVGVAAGGGWVSPAMLGSVLRELRMSAPAPNEFDERLRLLTAREREVLERMVAGLDHSTIARDLVVSVNTVRTHSQRILAKLEVHSGLEAVSIVRKARRNPI